MTFSYTITFNDSEIIMLEAALKLMIKNCQEKIENEPGRPPFWAHKQSAENVLERLNDNIQQMSGNNFFK